MKTRKRMSLLCLILGCVLTFDSSFLGIYSLLGMISLMNPAFNNVYDYKTSVFLGTSPFNLDFKGYPLFSAIRLAESLLGLSLLVASLFLYQKTDTEIRKETYFAILTFSSIFFGLSFFYLIAFFFLVGELAFAMMVFLVVLGIGYLLTLNLLKSREIQKSV
jgi:hypothetical protein